LSPYFHREVEEGVDLIAMYSTILSRRIRIPEIEKQDAVRT